MDDMIETVADAIDAARYAHPYYPRGRPRPFAESDRSEREYATRLARAAIMAMREPTPDMRIAGGIAWSNALPEAETYVDTADACYKAMIDVALNIHEREGS